MAYRQTTIQEFPIAGSFALENRVLGLLVGDPSYIDEAKHKLSEQSFEDNNNRKLWKTIIELDAKGEAVNIDSVYSKTDTKHFQEYILKNACLLTPTEAQSSIDGLYAITLKRKAYFAAIKMLQANQSENGAADAYQIAENFLRSVQDDLKDETTQSVKEAVNTFAQLVESREKARKEGKLVRIPTSFPTLDKITYNGWTAGQLIILAARPSIGKTAVMLQFARQAAISGANALVFSLEMTNNELVQRMICSTQMLNGYSLANGYVDWGKFEEATGKFTDLPLWFNDQSFTMDEIATKIRQASRKGICDIAFIDYLGLVNYPNDNRTIYQQVTETTKRLKRLAKESGIPIVLLCQLNRDMSKDGRAPELFDLRDSGSIEQDADIVLMLDRTLDTEKDYRLITMYVRKNRQNELATIKMRADDCMTNFNEIDND